MTRIPAFTGVYPALNSIAAQCTLLASHYWTEYHIPTFTGTPCDLYPSSHEHIMWLHPSIHCDHVMWSFMWSHPILGTWRNSYCSIHWHVVWLASQHSLAHGTPCDFHPITSTPCDSHPHIHWHTMWYLSMSESKAVYYDYQCINIISAHTACCYHRTSAFNNDPDLFRTRLSARPTKDGCNHNLVLIVIHPCAILVSISSY